MVIRMRVEQHKSWQQGALWSHTANKGADMEEWWTGMKWGKKKWKEKRKSPSGLWLVKQSEMILPSVLSEASSLVAKREWKKERKKEEGTNEGKGLTQMNIKRKGYKRKRNPRKEKWENEQTPSVKRKHKRMKRYTECQTEKRGDTREERSTVCIS